MQDKLKKLIKEGENERLDYKQSITDLNKIAKTICSFANTKGGKIAVGIKDDKSIVGIDPEEEKFMLIKAADFYCFPPVALIFEELEDEEMIVLVVEIKESHDKPHYIVDKNNNKLFYIRQNDKCLPAGKTMVNILKKEPGHYKPSKLDKYEKQVLQYLEGGTKITLKWIMKTFNFSQRRAGKLLKGLVLKSAIRLHEHENEDYYTI